MWHRDVDVPGSLLRKEDAAFVRFGVGMLV